MTGYGFVTQFSKTFGIILAKFNSAVETIVSGIDVFRKGENFLKTVYFTERRTAIAVLLL